MSSNPEVTVNKLLEEANALLETGGFAEAAEKSRQAAEMEPNNAGPHNYWGVALDRQQLTQEAAKHYRRAAELDPGFALAYSNLGSVLYRLENYADAAEQYRHAAKLDPANANYLLDWGRALAGQRKYADAIERYRKATELNPNDVSAWDRWGKALGAQRRYAEAIEMYRKAIVADPKNVTAHLHWGQALGDQGHYREAIEVLRHAVEIGPYDTYTYHNVAFYLWKKGDYKAAAVAWEQTMRAYERARDQANKERDADFFFYYGGILHEESGNLKMAEKVLLEGLKHDPDHTGLLTRLGTLYTARQQEAGVGNLPEEWSAGYWEARQYFSRAERLLRERIDGDSTDPAASQELGDVLLEMENYDEARVQYEKARQLDPQDPWPYNGLGVVCSRLEDYDRAAEYYEKALKLSPCDLAIWSNLAETYLKLNKVDRAEKEYRKILAVAAEHIDSVIGLGEVYTAMAEAGDPDLYAVALKSYDRAMALAHAGAGSKRLSGKELGQLFYARGYAAVKAYEAQGALGQESLLNEALRDFNNCVTNDPEHYKGERARHRIKDRRRAFTADWFTRKVAPWFILAPSIWVLILAQIAFYSSKKVEVIQYSALTFGALIFIVVGLFLPQIQKLKGAGLELEKSAVDQIASSAGLGIKK